MDEFEVEGIGHNLPFLSAVYDHREIHLAGDITTAFIAEEYPEGFEGVTLPDTDCCAAQLAAGAAAMRLVEIAAPGRRGPDHRFTVNRHDHAGGHDWVVSHRRSDIFR